MSSASEDIGGPLSGLQVLEFVSIGPGPHCAMLLSDLGAEVVRFDRPGGNGWQNPIMDRGRAVIEVDIRTDQGRALGLAASEKADVVIEGFRPGVMERLGLGPDIVLGLNPRLVYGRMTGWGQSGPLCRTAGHDINYLSMTGALAAIGPAGGPPTVPLNLIGDFGGGSMFLAFGIMAALWERERSGRGQVVDAAIIDGVASMMTMFTGLLPSGQVSMERDRNILGGAAPFYRCYQCADGLDIAVGAIEPQFYAVLVKITGAPEHFCAAQYDETRWPEQCSVFAGLFKEKPRDAWCRLFESADACFSPVLTVHEAVADTHSIARQMYIERNGMLQAAPAPRFSRTPGRIAPQTEGCATLREWGVDTKLLSAYS